MIEGYGFGRITVNGRTFYHDVIIYPEGVDGDWWRKEGHILSPEDLPAILSRRPDILIVGTGASGVMKVPEEVVERLKEQGIAVKVMDTRRACEEYNRLVKREKGKRIVAALHLTC